MATAQIAAPTIPQTVPEIKPRWRPTRFMCSDAGIVAIALPKIQHVTGNVARPLCGASDSPANPFIAVRVE
jgi:hypothetical protein